MKKILQQKETVFYLVKLLLRYAKLGKEGNMLYFIINS